MIRFKVFSNYVFVIFITILVIFYINFNSIEEIGGNENIWIEAENANSIIKPLKIIDMEGTSNNRGVTSIGGHLSNSGIAKYQFYAKKEGSYLVWGRCYWPLVCSNAFRISVDQSNSIIFGENSTINKWHWITGPKFELTKGKHELILWSQEENSQIDKILITNDPYFVPSGMGNSSELFIDFEDGNLSKDIKFKNKDKWEIVTDSLNNKLLTNLDNIGKDEYVLMQTTNSDSYIFRLVLKIPDPLNNSNKVYLNYQNDSNNLNISIKNGFMFMEHVVDNDIDNRIELDSIKSGTYDLAVLKNMDNVLVKLNGNKLLEYIDSTLGGLQVGVALDNGKIYYDNLAIMSDVTVNYFENFHGARHFKLKKDRPEISTDYFSPLKMGMLNWWNYSGTWNIISDGFEVLNGAATDGRDAIAIFGDYFWKDYQFSIAAKKHDSCNFGIIFNLQDINNYYRLTLSDGKNRKFNKISKFVNGKEIVLDKENKVFFKSGDAYWYQIDILNHNGLINISIDEELMFSLKDTTFTNGKFGLWSGSERGVSFDDIEITSYSPEGDTSNEYNYELFRKNLTISKDLSNWIPSDNDVIQQIEISPDEWMVCANKEVLKKAKLSYKKTLKDNFEILLNTSKIPRDIDLIFNFQDFTKPYLNRQLIFSNQRVYLKANDTEIASNYISLMKRNLIEIKREAEIWKIKLDNKEEIELKDNYKHNSLNFEIGFDGIGKGKIFIYQIKIKDHI